jgi:hypothetical protein
MDLHKEVSYLIVFTGALKIPAVGQDKSDGSLLRERMANSDTDNDDHGKVSKVESALFA